MKKSLNCRFIILSILLCLILAGVSSAQNDNVLDENTLRVQVHHFGPWKVIQDNQKISGIDLEFLQLIAKEMQLKIKFITAPFKRGLVMMEQGNIDVMTGLLKRPDREAYINYIDPPYKTASNKTFYVLKGQGSSIQTYEDLYKLNRIGVGDGGKYFKRFDADDKLNKKILVGNPSTFLEKIVDLLLIKRIDAFCQTESVMDYYLINNKLQDRIEKTAFVYSKPIKVYMGISKKSPFMDRKEEFQGHLERLLKEGWMDKIKSDFFNKLEKSDK
jgi:polar amino acid transport system substrate-binding protein